MKVAVDAWASEYGSSFQEDDVAASDAPDVDVFVEQDASSWGLVNTTHDPADSVLFIDGVRRTDARVWVTPDGHDEPTMAVAASYAAGAAHFLRGTTTLAASHVGRNLFAVAGAPDLDGGPGAHYPLRAVAKPTEVALSRSIQDRMSNLEREVAQQATSDVDDPVELTVIDGPLPFGRLAVPGAVGYIKTHHRQYLPDEQRKLVGQLDAGQRTPLFLFTTSYSRYSWYLRLPGADANAHPWAGVVRCEADPGLSVPDAVSLANLTTATVPRFASKRSRDARAPQNLTSIGSLERHLKHQLGDRLVLERRLRRAARQASAA